MRLPLPGGDGVGEELVARFELVLGEAQEVLFDEEVVGGGGEGDLRLRRGVEVVDGEGGALGGVGLDVRDAVGGVGVREGTFVVRIVGWLECREGLLVQCRVRSRELVCELWRW